MTISMDVKTAILKGDAEALRQLLAEDSSRANELIEWGNKKKCLTHPLHFVSDMLFNGALQKVWNCQKTRAARQFAPARRFLAFCHPTGLL